MFGESIRYLFCGGSALDPAIRRFYRAAGLDMLDAYALTETASSLSIAYSGSANCESVGVVFEIMEVKIDKPDAQGFGEIIVKGDNIFLGYFNDEAATHAAFDANGYFRTGDIGYLRCEGAERGTLYVRGRIDALKKSSKGEWVTKSE